MVIKIKKSKITYLLLFYFTTTLVIHFCFLEKTIKNLYFFDQSTMIVNAPLFLYKYSFVLLIAEFIIITFLTMHVILIYLFVEAFKKIIISAEQFTFDRHNPEILKFTHEPNIIQESFHAINKMQKRIIHLFERHTKGLAMIIHDLRTPLTRIKLHIQLLEDTHNIEKIIKNIDEIDYMLSDILWFARNAFERERKRWLDLSALLKTLCEEYNEIGFIVQFESTKNQASFFGKPRALTRAFTNLIENALKHTDTQPIVVILEILQDNIFIIIRDQGPGIAQQELEHVFNPYYQGSNKVNGFGLGLTIVKDIITNHQGKITMRNHPKNGLEVCIVFKANNLLP